MATNLLDEFRVCLDTGREEPAQRFLASHSTVLSRALGIFDGHVFPKFRLGSEFVCDFLLVSSSSYGPSFTFVELEPPSARPFTKAGVFGKRLNEALKQIDDWTQWILKYPEYFNATVARILGWSESREIPMALRVPSAIEAVVIIGRSSFLTPEDNERRRALYYHGHRKITVTHYDRLLFHLERDVISAELKASNLESARLDELSMHSDSYVRLQVARYADCTEQVLFRLAADPDYNVRAGVATHRQTPLALLDRLASDVHQSVRREVARNPHVRGRVLKRLFSEFPRDLIRNPACPKSLVQELALHKDSSLRYLAASSPSASADLLDMLSKDTWYSVRLAVANNPKTRTTTVFELASDSWRLVRTAALATLERSSIVTPAGESA